MHNRCPRCREITDRCLRCVDQGQGGFLHRNSDLIAIAFMLLIWAAWLVATWRL